MSHENVEVARRCIDAYNRRDWAALRRLNDTDIELDWSASRGVEAGVYRGIDDVLGVFKAYYDTFGQIVIEADRYIDAGESVVVPNMSRSTGRDGIEVLARSAIVITSRAGKVVRIRLYQETEQALKAVGLAE